MLRWFELKDTVPVNIYLIRMYNAASIGSVFVTYNMDIEKEEHIQQRKSHLTTFKHLSLKFALENIY